MSAKKNSLRQRVRRVYSQERLARVLTLPEEDFARAFGMETVKVEPAGYSPSWREPADFYHFKDNGARVLAVAHLDTVVGPEGRVPTFRNTQTGPLVRSGALDDRLGAYVILDMLPKLGVKTDVLLTVGEESAASTAEYFDPQGREYDHVIEFDRGGTDVVMYQFHDDATAQLVQAAGARVGHGTFSDIAYLEHLGVKCLNWGVGYGGNYHSENGYAYLFDTFAMVARYLRFSQQNAGIALPHTAAPKYSYYGSYDRGRDQDERCWLCDQYQVNLDTGYCEACKTCQECSEIDVDCLCYLPAGLRAKAASTGNGFPAVRDGYGNDWEARYLGGEFHMYADCPDETACAAHKDWPPDWNGKQYLGGKIHLYLDCPDPAQCKAHKDFRTPRDVPKQPLALPAAAEDSKTGWTAAS